jgi:hypothetical protein
VDVFVRRLMFLVTFVLRVVMDRPEWHSISGCASLIADRTCIITDLACERPDILCGGSGVEFMWLAGRRS